MKYGREHDYGDSIRLIDVVTIPEPIPNGLGSVEAWLAVQFPTLSGFFPVAEWNTGGDVKNLDGTFGTPPTPPTP